MTEDLLESVFVIAEAVCSRRNYQTERTAYTKKLGNTELKINVGYGLFLVHDVRINKYRLTKTKIFKFKLPKKRVRGRHLHKGLAQVEALISTFKTDNLVNKEDKLRNKNYHKIYEADILYKLKLVDDYISEGKCISKAAKCAEIDYEVVKGYLENKGEIKC